MSPCAAELVRPLPPEVSAYLSRLLECCLDIRRVWLLGQDGEPAAGLVPRWELLVFADAPTLHRLRKSPDLHREDIDVFVVIDGDRFENAWGRGRLSGSLVRWAWRELENEAFYNESRWAGTHDLGNVVRIRRKAVLL